MVSNPIGCWVVPLQKTACMVIKGTHITATLIELYHSLANFKTAFLVSELQGNLFNLFYLWITVYINIDNFNV